MPVKYITYGCKFRCGRRHGPLKKIREHEKKCWYDPENRTCITCRFEKLLFERGGIYRDCARPEADVVFIRNYRDTRDVPETDCEFWEKRRSLNSFS